MKTKDGNNVSILELTPENYLVPQGEEMVYHCRLELVDFDKKTGARKSKPKIVKVGQKAFEKYIRDTWLKQGYKLDILYNPNEWIKARLEAKSAGKVNAKAKQEAEIQKRIDEAVAKALAAKETKKTKAKKEKEETK